MLEGVLLRFLTVWHSRSVIDLRHQPVGNKGEEFERFDSATSNIGSGFPGWDRKIVRIFQVKRIFLGCTKICSVLFIVFLLVRYSYLQDSYSEVLL